jgi:hypothetical protein
MNICILQEEVSKTSCRFLKPAKSHRLEFTPSLCFRPQAESGISCTRTKACTDLVSALFGYPDRD